MKKLCFFGLFSGDRTFLPVLFFLEIILLTLFLLAFVFVSTLGIKKAFFDLIHVDSERAFTRACPFSIWLEFFSLELYAHYFPKLFSLFCKLWRIKTKSKNVDTFYAFHIILIAVNKFALTGG